MNATVPNVTKTFSFLKKRRRVILWSAEGKRKIRLNGKGTWLRGFARIVAAVDGGISLASFDGEGEEGGPTGAAGLASRNDDDDDGRGERRNKKLQMNSLAELSRAHSLRNGTEVWLKSTPPSLASRIESPKNISRTLYDISPPLAAATKLTTTWAWMEMRRGEERREELEIKKG